MNKTSLRLLLFGGIGDVILTTPAIREWRKQNPSGKLSVYGMAKIQLQILAENPHIDSFHLYRRPLVSFPFLKGFVKPYSLIDYQKLIPSLTPRIHATQSIADMLGLSLSSQKPELFFTDHEKKIAKQRLAGISTPVALHTTARCSDNKNWPAGNYQNLVSRCSDYTFVQLGEKTEPLVEGAVDMRGLPLRGSMAILGYSAAFIGPDSGLAHAAAALDVPAVIPFGPSTPEVWGHPQATNVYMRMRCSPCIDILREGTCPYGRKCMNAIDVSTVEQALRNHLESSYQSPEVRRRSVSGLSSHCAAQL